MEIVSWQFGVFVVVTLFIYYALPHSKQNVWLLLASYSFYFTFEKWFAVLLMAITFVTFFVARRMTASPSHNLKWLWVGLGFNLLALIAFKLLSDDYGFQFARFLFTPLSTKVLMPLGLAFYTLQAISYLLDVYHRRLGAANSFVNFALYLSYFPKVVSGPLERARTFLPKLERPRRVTNETIARSFALILIGLFRKIVIADLLPYMLPKNVVWSGINSPYKTLEVILWIVVYAFRLYNDFAGYTSIARGVSGLFGIELSANFQQPFFARSLSEFWSRWHISFTQWLRDYIYFPLSRWLLSRSNGRRNFINTIVPPLATMVASGLWHAFTLNMVVWGVMHGAYLAGERLIEWWRPTPPQGEQPKLRQVASALVVFSLVTLAWVPFAINTLTGDAGVLSFWQAIVIPHIGFTAKWYLVVMLPMTISLWLDWNQYHSQNETFFLAWTQPKRSFVLAVAVLILVVIGTTNKSSVFVYQGF